jgi:hypothetical protein
VRGRDAGRNVDNTRKNRYAYSNENDVTRSRVLLDLSAEFTVPFRPQDNQDGMNT